eukprot:15473996-Alexandrium_andersonii.AAC.1
MQPRNRMCKSAPPHAQEVIAAHAEPPVLAAATGIIATTRSESVAKPSFAEARAVVRLLRRGCSAQ